MIKWFRRRKKAEPDPQAVRASEGGRVVSIKVGASRARISVEDDSGAIQKYFVDEIKTRPERRVKAGEVLGLLDK